MTAPITVNEFRAFPALPDNTGMTDAQLSSVINYAWSTIERSCNQKLSLTEHFCESHEHPSMTCSTKDGILTIIPKNLFIRSVSEVRYSTVEELYVPVLDQILVRDIVKVSPSPFTDGQHGYISIEYSYGFDPVPDDLKLACILMTNHLLSAGFFPTNGGLSDGTLAPRWIPPDVEAIICKYRRYR